MNADLKFKLNTDGYAIIPNVWNEDKLARVSDAIRSLDITSDNCLVTKDLFAIRQFLNFDKQLCNLILDDSIKEIVCQLGGKDYFLTKAIYFDKPKTSNWFVPFHQDLSISVKNKFDIEGFGQWTNKNGQVGVHPPLEILENIITLRIHLDTTDDENGALKVIPKSHTQGIVRKEELDLSNAHTCNVNSGDIMLMKPLTFHASGRSNGKRDRRVIHLEFSNKSLTAPIDWLEKVAL